MTLSASGICEIPIETDRIVFMWRRSATARKRQHGISTCRAHENPSRDRFHGCLLFAIAFVSEPTRITFIYQGCILYIFIFKVDIYNAAVTRDEGNT